jgi:hypothetical protein
MHFFAKLHVLQNASTNGQGELLSSFVGIPVLRFFFE